MQQKTKQRIVGTIVLLALALIFLPMIFDGQGSYQPPMSSRIPEPPTAIILPEPVQTRPVILADNLPENTDSTDISEAPVETDASINDLLTAQQANAGPGTDEPATGEQQAAGETNGQGSGEPSNTQSAAAPTPNDQSPVTTASAPDFTADPPGLGSDGLPRGWSVRLGSFSNGANAARLMQRLQDSGYRAYTRPIDSAQGELTGVFVGPWLDQERVESYRQELQSQFQLAGIVVRYELPN